MKAELLDLCDQVLSAMLTGVGQGILVVILAVLALRVFPGTNAATRHATWFVLLLLVSALIPANLLLSRVSAPAGDAPKQAAGSPSETGPSIADNFPIPAAPDTLESSIEALNQEVPPAHDEFGEPDPTDAFSCLVSPETSPSIKEESSEPMPQELTATLPPESTEESIVSKNASTGAAQSAVTETSRGAKPLAAWRIDQQARIPRYTSLVALSLCAVIALARLLVLFYRLWSIRRLKRSGSPPDGPLHEAFEHLCAKMSLRRAVDLRISTTGHSPIVLGFLRPVILLPVCPDYGSGGELEHILRHELAHVSRWDDWANLAQQMLQAIFFFHPAIIWIGRRLTLEREIACDDSALQHGSAPRAYALLLTEFASRTQQRRLLPAPGVFTSKSQLKQRISMILNTKRNTSSILAKTRLGLITSLAATCAALAIYAGPRLVLAQSAGQAANATTPVPPVPVTSGPVPAVAVISANNATPAIVAVAGVPTAEAPDIPVPPGVPSSPKFKDGPGAGLPAPAKVGPPPLAPQPRPGALPPPTPRGNWFAMEGPAPMPKMAHSPGDPHGFPGDSIEARLQRLEEMVRTLMEGQNLKPVPGGDALFKEHHPKAWVFQPGNPDNIHLRAQREAEAAQQEKLAKDLEKLAKNRAEWNEDAKGKIREQKLDALRKAREDLEKQVERLDRQIEELEKAKEHLRSELEHQSDLLQEESEQAEEAEAEAEVANKETD